MCVFVFSNMALSENGAPLNPVAHNYSYLSLSPSPSCQGRLPEAEAIHIHIYM